MFSDPDEPSKLASPKTFLLTINRLLIKLQEDKNPSQHFLVAKQLFERFMNLLKLEHTSIAILKSSNIGKIKGRNKSIFQIQIFLGSIDINKDLMTENLNGRLISNHPVHIFDANGNISPSAFIPFCEFGEDRSKLGMKHDNFSVQVCNAFTPKIVTDQLCYEIDLQSYRSSDNYHLKKQLNAGLILVLDYNMDRVKYKDISNKIEDIEPTSIGTSFASTLFEYQNPKDVLVIIDGIGNLCMVNLIE